MRPPIRRDFDRALTALPFGGVVLLPRRSILILPLRSAGTGIVRGGRHDIALFHAGTIWPASTRSDDLPSHRALARDSISPNYEQRAL